MSIHDAKSYKTAKIVASDLEKVLNLMKSMQTTMLELNAYRRYKHVSQFVESYVDSRAILEIQYNKYNELKKSKGVK